MTVVLWSPSVLYAAVRSSIIEKLLMTNSTYAPTLSVVRSVDTLSDALGVHDSCRISF